MSSTYAGTFSMLPGRRGQTLGLSSTDQLPSMREGTTHPSTGSAPLLVPPASLLDKRARQLDRLYGAVDNVWHRDNGKHRRELRAVLALVDSGDMSIADAVRRTADLDRGTSRAAA